MKTKRNKDKDLRKLAKAFFDNLEGWNESYDFVGIGLNDKRPFGNTDVEDDILRIVGAEDDRWGPTWSREQVEYAFWLYKALPAWLKKNCGRKL